MDVVDSVGLDGDVPVVVGLHTEVTLRGDGGWARTSDLQRLAVQDANGSDLVGWMRNGDGAWVAVGATATRSREATTTAVRSGCRRTDAPGSASRGPSTSLAIATPLSPAPAACPTATCWWGSVENPGTGTAPLAFRRTAGEWKRVDLSGLGKSTTALTSCAGVGDEVVLQGRAQSDKAWKTVDGATFEAVEIGTEDDYVGSIIALEEGYAAPGQVSRGINNRAVVWLSADGVTWRAVDVPTDRATAATDLLARGERLLVTSTNTGGVTVAVLDNPAELLQAS